MPIGKQTGRYFVSDSFFVNKKIVELSLNNAAVLCNNNETWHFYDRNEISMS